MKKLIKEHSIYLLLITLAELILSTVCIIAFVYTDTLSYSDALVFKTLGVETLLESIYTSTWWALVLFTLACISIFSLTSIVFKKQEYFFISICLWCLMFVLSINLTQPIKQLLLTSLLFVPIFGLNIIAYKDEKKKLNNVTKTKKRK